ncbi:YeeE/YedE family protein [Caldalkalibacillus salinus]|uniref:YeeE/YedE family protein n=1 Tax=Caldalkalibacillus salinus TaxID=2803787 RepID=UPI001924A8CE|nr:YeeE/YedE family protein [Caldalkalibacillus salinus]
MEVNGLLFTLEALMIACIFGFIYGFLLQKADFCFVASFRDWVSVRDTRVGKGMLVLMATAVLGWGIALTFGMGQASVAHIWSLDIGLTNLLGGFLFGIGMTIAGSCASGALYRAGMGYIQFWIVILAMLVGNVLFAYVYDPYAIDYVLEPLTWTDGITLYDVLPIPYLLLSALIVSLILVPTLLRFGWHGFWHGVKNTFQDFKDGNMLTKSHWDIRFVGFVMGVAATAQFVLLSSISITGPETRIAGTILSFIIGEEHILNNLYFSTLFAQHPTVGLGPEEFLVIFVIVGAFVSALLSKSFKIRVPRLNRLPYPIIGGLLMGIASRIAPGCNIANVVAGVGGLSVHSFIAMLGMACGIFVVTAYVFKMPIMLFQKDPFKM